MPVETAVNLVSAREAALAAFSAGTRRPAALVAYRSRGRLLIVGSETQIEAVQTRLGRSLVCVGLTPTGPGTPAGVRRGVVPVARAPVAACAGFLGAFRVSLSGPAGPVGLGELLPEVGDTVDLVLDLGLPPLIDRSLPPPGYFAPGADARALEEALQRLPELVGEFEKPKYFEYDPSICAHARSGITACTRCIDACPARAIGSIGERIAVDPNLCQGAGTCATACPTGAIRYVYPPAGDILDGLRALIRAYRAVALAPPVLLIHDREHGQAWLAQLADRLPENVVPVAVEETGSLGLEIWLAALAYGAAAVRLLCTDGIPEGVVAVLEAQLRHARTLLAGMGYPADAVALVDGTTPVTQLAPPAAMFGTTEFSPAGFAGLDDKRRVARLALEHLYRYAPTPRPVISLEAGAPFGEVWLDGTRCTLCMACVSQCPGKALEAGEETPMLRFIEDNCVQCGLCGRVCPENAIGPSPRYLFDTQRRLSPRLLKEEPPFRCVRCGKPFATRSVIDRMTTRLGAHPMFQGQALRRLQMCEDCRVKDMYEAEYAAHQAEAAERRG